MYILSPIRDSQLLTDGVFYLTASKCARCQLHGLSVSGRWRYLSEGLKIYILSSARDFQFNFQWEFLQAIKISHHAVRSDHKEICNSR
jgi:hypothetical protein